MVSVSLFSGLVTISSFSKVVSDETTSGETIGVISMLVKSFIGFSIVDFLLPIIE